MKFTTCFVILSLILTIFSSCVSEETTEGKPESPEVTLEKGDLDGNGVVDDADVELLQKYLSNPEKTQLIGEPDLNEDGKVNIEDLTVLLNIINEK